MRGWCGPHNSRYRGGRETEAVAGRCDGEFGPQPRPQAASSRVRDLHSLSLSLFILHRDGSRRLASSVFTQPFEGVVQAVRQEGLVERPVRRLDYRNSRRCHVLPRALSPDDDQRLQEEFQRSDDLCAQALLLTRATGLRIGECVDLSVDCLRAVGDQQWALHVPLGKLYTERLVPADENIRMIVARLLRLRALGLRPPEKVFLKHFHFKMFWAILSHAGLSSPPCPSAQTAPG